MQLFSEANSSKLLDYHDVVSNEWRFPCSVTLSCLLSQQWSHQSWTWTLTYLGTCVVTRGSLLHCSALLVTSVWWAPGQSSSCVQWDQLLQETICCHHLNIAPVNTWYKSEFIMHSEVQRYSTLKLFYCWWLELCCGVSLYLWCYCPMLNKIFFVLDDERNKIIELDQNSLVQHKNNKEEGLKWNKMSTDGGRMSGWVKCLMLTELSERHQSLRCLVSAVW